MSHIWFHRERRSDRGATSELAISGLVPNIFCKLHGQGFLDQMLRNSSRGRGRPRTFDESEALEKATQIFWSRSYDGVAIDDLVAGMGVGRQSLYSVFGDKRTLFLRVLRTYAERKGAGAAKALFTPPALRDAIAGFLRHAVEVATQEGSVPGCLMVCVAPLVDDAEVRQFLKDAAAGGVALVERRFHDGIS